jgi:predicted branched-subunit amino acid permease
VRHLLASPDFREGFVEMLPACVGLVPFGVVCGVGAAAAGADWLGSLGMSLIIFSGAAQIVASQLMAANAPLAVIVLTAAVLGLRLLMYSAAIAPYFKPLPPRWQRVLAFLLSDQVFASSLRRFARDDDRAAAGRHFLGCGVALWVTWQVACMAGFFAGNLIPSAWSLEFAVPLCFLALLAPLFRDSPSLLAALTAGIAVLALAHLPMKLNLFVAGLLGILVGTLADFARERWTRR